VSLNPGKISLIDSARQPYEIDWQTWQPSERCVLTVLYDASNVLLIDKLQGFGTGKVSVPGGRIEPGETPLQAAVRETEEEVGLTPLSLREAGRLHFAFTHGFHMHVTVFATQAWEGDLRSTDEARPFWCRRSEIPYGRMWSDDLLWVPLLFEERPFDGHFVFEDNLSLWHQIHAPSAQPG